MRLKPIGIFCFGVPIKPPASCTNRTYSNNNTMQIAVICSIIGSMLYNAMHIHEIM